MREDIAFEMVASTVRYGVGVTAELGMDLAAHDARRVLALTDTPDQDISVLDAGIRPVCATISRSSADPWFRESGCLLMSDPHDTPRPRPHTGSMASTFLEFDLRAEWQSLLAESTWSTGHNAKTLAKYDDLRVVLIAFRAGARLAEHKTDGRISVHLLSGHVRVKADGRTFDLRPGSLLTLDQGVPHDVDALEESALLLTIARPARARA